MSQSLISSCAYGIMGVMMPAAGTDTKSLSNAWRKTNEQEFSNSLKIEYGFSPALARSLVQLMHEHIETKFEARCAKPPGSKKLRLLLREDHTIAYPSRYPFFGLAPQGGEFLQGIL